MRHEGKVGKHSDCDGCKTAEGSEVDRGQGQDPKAGQPSRKLRFRGMAHQNARASSCPNSDELPILLSSLGIFCLLPPGKASLRAASWPPQQGRKAAPSPGGRTVAPSRGEGSHSSSAVSALLSPLQFPWGLLTFLRIYAGLSEVLNNILSSLLRSLTS